MFYVLVKFTTNPEPVMMTTLDLRHAPWLATMENVEWVSPTISNGNALGYRHPLGGETLEGARAGDYYVSAYRPQTPAPARQDQEQLAIQSQDWETPQAITAARKVGFGL